MATREEARSETTRLGGKVTEHDWFRGRGFGLGQRHHRRMVSGQLRLHRVRACRLCKLRREGSLLHVVASVLRPESCTADDCGHEGAPAVDMV